MAGGGWKRVPGRAGCWQAACGVLPAACPCALTATPRPPCMPFQPTLPLCARRSLNGAPLQPPWPPLAARRGQEGARPDRHQEPGRQHGLPDREAAQGVCGQGAPRGPASLLRHTCCCQNVCGCDHPWTLRPSSRLLMGVCTCVGRAAACLCTYDARLPCSRVHVCMQWHPPLRPPTCPDSTLCLPAPRCLCPGARGCEEQG